MLDGREWRVGVDLPEAQTECHKVAECLDVMAIVNTMATKETFLKKAPLATVLHIGKEGFVCTWQSNEMMWKLVTDELCQMQSIGNICIIYVYI